MRGKLRVPCFLQLRGQARQEEKRQNQSSHRKNHKFNGGPKGGDQFVEKGSRNQYHSDHSHKNWYSSQDKRTTMTVSVTQEQMRQNVFHHTLTVPLSSPLSSFLSSSSVSINNFRSKKTWIAQSSHSMRASLKFWSKTSSLKPQIAEKSL